MQFLYPNLLWGLLAVTIPIIIHYFNFRRVKKVAFSNIEFLKEVNTKAKSFLKLKHRLIMLSRILFISALVLAFAQPFLPSKTGFNKNGNSIISLYIDNSASMQNEQEGKALLDIAKTKANKLLDILPRYAKVQVITNDFGAEEFELLNPANAKNAIAKINKSTAVKSLEQVYLRQASLAAKNGNLTGNTLINFSDFQKNTIGNIGSLAKMVENKMYLVPVGYQSDKNIYVDSVWLDIPFTRKLQPNGLNVRIKNNATSGIAKANVKAFLGNLQLNAIQTEIQSKASSTVHFDINIADNGYLKGKISIEDSPVTFDNDYFFVINGSPRINIVHIQGLANNSYIRNTYSNDSLFNYAGLNANAIDYGILKKADLLIVEGLIAFDDNLKNTVNEINKTGAGLLVIPSKAADLNNYQSALNNLGISKIQANSGVNLGLKPMAEVDRTNDFFKDIFEAKIQKERMIMPNTAELFQWGGVLEPILKTRGDIPYLAKVKTKSNLFVLASPIDIEYGNFAQNALFLPILYKIAAMSVKSKPLAYRFDQNNIVLNVGAGINKNTVFKLKKDNIELIPAQRLLNNDLILEIPKPDQASDANILTAGYFDLFSPTTPKQTIAINYSNQESILDGMTIADLKNSFANNKLISVSESTNNYDFANEFKSENDGKYFWKYLVWAALIFLLIEILLIRFWK